MNRLVHHIDEIILLPPDRSSNSPSVLVFGKTYTSGWDKFQLIPNRLKNAESGLHELRFTASPPEDDFSPLTTRVTSIYVFPAGSRVKKVRVIGETNQLESTFIDGMCIDFGQAGGVKTRRTTNARQLAVGYSDKMNFQEALKSALNNFPDPRFIRSAYMDGIRVVETGIVAETEEQGEKMYIIIEG